MAKLFIYLDEYKMYSLSSQLFEGLTEEIVQISSRSKEETEEQKGPLRSGKLLADIVSDSEGRQERRFLYDYAYTVFEQQLIDDGRVVTVSPTKRPESDAFDTPHFVKVSGRMTFHDLAAIQRTAREINRFMTAIQYVSTSGVRDAQAMLLRAQLETAKGQHRQALDKQLRTLFKPEQVEAMD